MTDPKPAISADAVPAATVSRIAWRILPLLGVAYLFAYMDRVNIGFAALQMNADLGFSATVYGLGGGLFFLAYALFEVPSNLVLARVGARRWIARIMITWGLLAAATMLVRAPWQFYLVRFCLGAAEAGFFPGIVYYLSHWLPKPVRGRTFSVVYMLGALAGVVIGAVSPVLLSFDGTQGLAGWQWLFLVEGLPAALIGVLVLVFLPDDPEKVRWLADREKATLAGVLAGEADELGRHAAHGVLAALRHPQVWRLGLFGFLTIGTGITFTLSAPQMLEAAGGLGTADVGRLTSLAGVLAAGGILLAGVMSDKRGERFSSMVTSTMVMVICYALMALSTHGHAAIFVAAYLTWAFASFAVSFSNVMCWPDLIPRHLLGVGCAAINTVSQLGAFLMPYAWGATQDATNGFGAGLAGLAVAAALAVVVALAARAQASAPQLAPASA